MSITAHELALKCGVSRGSVDRALKGRPGINPQTRDKILEAAKEYDYRPNFIGQALSSGRTKTIGIVIFDFRHSFFAELYSAFEHEADIFNYVSLPMLSYHEPEREMECIRRLVDRNVDGLIILPVNRGEEYENFLKSLKIPVVCIGNRLSAEFPFSGIDDRQAAHDAADYLAGKGCERIYYYCPPVENKKSANIYAQEQRLAGYEEGLAANQFKGEAITNQEKLLEHLEHYSGNDNVAVMCSNDFYALELQILFRDRHPDLYNRVKIMGFDGLDVLRFSIPAIPSVAFSRKTWALKAFGQIFNMLSGKTVADEIIAHSIIETMQQEFK